MPADPGVARRYYHALDAGDYDALADLLAPDVVHHRPDRTFEGRETLVAFMREGRPMTDTSHELAGVFVGADVPEVVVRGRLLDADGEPLFAFADAFEFDSAGAIRAIYTYTR